MGRDSKPAGVTVHVVTAYGTNEQQRVVGAFSTKIRAVQACYVDHQHQYERVLASPSWSTHGRVMQTCTRHVCYQIAAYRLDEQIRFYK